jgi:hypothetical protein
MATPSANSVAASVASLSKSTYINALFNGAKLVSGIGAPIQVTYSFPSETT